MINPKTKKDLREALDALVRAVPDEFTTAVAGEWAARTQRQIADEKLEAALFGPNSVLRKFLKRYFKLQVGESIDIRKKQWYVNYDRSAMGAKGREQVFPSISFSVYVGTGVTVKVEFAPHHSCWDPDKKVQVLMKTVERVRLMLEAARQA